LVIIAAVVSVWFFLGGTESVTYNTGDYEQPLATDALIYLMYGFVFISALLVLANAVWQFVSDFRSNAKQALKSVAGVGLLILLCLVAYILADGTPIKILGDETQLSTAWYKAVDAQLIVMYVLAVIALLLMAFGGLVKKIGK